MHTVRSAKDRYCIVTLASCSAETIDATELCIGRLIIVAEGTVQVSHVHVAVGSLREKAAQVRHVEYRLHAGHYLSYRRRTVGNMLWQNAKGRGARQRKERLCAGVCDSRACCTHHSQQATDLSEK